MSLLLPNPTIASLRRGGSLSALASALAMAAMLAAAPAIAQNGPLSLTPPPAVPTGPQSADPGMKPAQKAANDKRYDEAIAGFDRVLAANPRNAQARFQRAWAMAKAGHEDEAIQAFAEMAQDFPELPEPHNNLALLYAKRGDLKRAEAELLLAIEAKPDYAISYSNLGDIYRALAVQAYGDAVRRNPGDKRAAASLRELQPASSPPAAPAKAQPKASVKAPAKAQAKESAEEPTKEPTREPAAAPASSPAAH
ncbi:tetratricopeptide repeat protein [Cupriavidus sp. BIS7]|uniref:tetratricopeptide repeat protein n=1 Tax=Cupriavidus sp. BIS7 TaxID=1217718 RepID=UPI00031FF8D0|nr:tetratricopeptide repeat protein [Cupriavidus sp. BIS7]